ncbi:MAG: extracellular solute-binding protein [Treponema sp.]|jgi:putative aldouronate transport system substrate-binding protein|nr:extracellular solute-binding protein [Treponema sp.]
MKKKIFGVAAVILCVVIVMIGCHRQTVASDDKTGKPIEITVEIFDRGTDGGKTDPTNNKWTQWIQEKLLKDENIIVKFIAVPRWEETQALINLMAAGNPPDVCYTYSADNINNWALQGGIFDLAPYVDTTLKDLRDFLGPDNALPGRDLIRRQLDNTTGKLYFIPSRRMNVAMRNIFIRKDWLDALGLPLPSTTQEWYEALVAFKEKDPGNVGKANVVPFSMTTDARWTAANIIDSFIDPNISNKELWINQIAERNFLIPGYKEGVRFINKLFNEGLVDRNFPLYTSSSDAQYNLIKSGVVGSYSQSWDDIYREPNGVLSDLRKNVPTADMVPVDCATSSDGLTHKSSYDAAGLFYFIPVASKQPEAAMRYLNWLSKYENYHFIQTGPEGIVHTLVDGLPKIIPNASDGWIQNSPQNIDYTLPMNGLFLGSDEINIKALANGYSWPPELIVNAYNIAMTNARPGIVVSTKAPLTAIGPLQQTLIDKGVVIYTESITAPVADFDRVYDAGIADWLNSGAQKVLDERRENYIEP